MGWGCFSLSQIMTNHKKFKNFICQLASYRNISEVEILWQKKKKYFSKFDTAMESKKENNSNLSVEELLRQKIVELESEVIMIYEQN